jgi:hypothetical protein
LKNGTKLHTALLEKLFGPIQLKISKQENELRIVHLYDSKHISRTLGVVRFKNDTHPIINEAHSRILGGALLGKTLTALNIPYQKSTIFGQAVTLPAWLIRDFDTTQNTTMAIYSQISIQDSSSNEAFVYADLFEIIPPDILHLIPMPQANTKMLEQELIALLGFAGITGVFNDINL